MADLVFCAAADISAGQEVVMIDSIYVRAKAAGDPASVAILVADADYSPGEIMTVASDSIFVTRPSEDLARGEVCNLCADGRVRKGRISMFGLGRPALALHDALEGHLAVIRFDPELEKHADETIEETLARLGAALDELTGERGGVKVLACPAYELPIRSDC